MDKQHRKELSAAYWFRTLANETDAMDIPGYQGNTGRSDEITKVEVTLPKPVVEKVLKLCNGNENLVYVCLINVFSIVLSRYSNAQHFLLGTALPQENLSGEKTGFFYLHQVIDEKESFKRSLQIQKNLLQEASTHLPMEIDAVIDKLQINNKTQSLGNLNKVGFVDARILGTAEESPYELTVSYGNKNKGLQFIASYSSPYYDQELIKQLLTHTYQLLDRVTEEPDVALQELHFLSQKEIDHLLKGNTRHFHIPEKKVFDNLKAHALSSPTVEALIFKDEKWSYKALYDESRKLASFLLAQGVKEEKIVGAYLDRSPRLVITILAIWQAGGVYLPLNPTLPGERVKGQLKDAEVSFVITEKIHIKEANRFQWECAALEKLFCIDSNDFYSEIETTNESMNQELWEFIGDRASEDLITMGGWYNSFTGLPFREEEMDEYVANAKQKLLPYLNVDQTSVLEIGCGSGLTMRAIAPLVKSYDALDLSATVIDFHRKHCKKEGLENVKLEVMAAHEINQLSGKFDVIIINSVVQNFHGYNYLRDVIAKCIDLCHDEAIIFLGDIMDSERKAEMIDDLTRFKIENDDQGYHTKIDWKEELFVDKSFFFDLGHQFKSISQTTTTEKLGQISNELRDYRYDVVLSIDLHHKENPQPRPRIKWQYDTSDLIYPVASLDSVNHSLHDLAYVIYTSGSTGAQKGAMVEHLGMMNHMYGKIQDLHITSSDVIAQNASQSFDISIWQLFTSIITGGTTVIYENDVALYPDMLVKAVAKDQISILELVPMYLKEALSILKAQNLVSSWNGLNYLMVTGEIVKPNLVNEWLASFADVPLVNAYGPTEASDDITHFITTNPVTIERVPVGKPLINCNIYILDKDKRLCPTGVIGDLYVSGVCVGRGYLKDPQKTAAAFTTDPFSKSDPVRMYYTGDMGCWMPDGNIDFHGRQDRQVKIRGNRIELGDIEHHLQQIDGIDDAVVLLGKGTHDEAVLRAVIIPQKELNPELEVIRKQLGLKVPSYAIPNQILVLDQFPLTTNGKVDHKKLAGLLEDDQRTTYERPITPYEKYLADLWGRLLEKQKISIDDNFFDLGGHSLKATKVVSSLFKEKHISLPIKDVFDYPTIRALAVRLEEAGKLSYQSIPAVQSRSHYPVTHAQKRMWVLSQLEDGNTAYNISGAFLIKGKLNIPAFETAINQVVARHTILRSRFFVGEEEVFQEVMNDLIIPLNHHDYSGKSSWQKDAHDFLESEGRAPLDLSEGPLLKLHLIKGNEQEFCFVYVMHHIISDGWSAKVLLKEIGEQYDANIFGKKDDLEPLPFQYTDYSCWLENFTNTEVYLEAEQYWIQRFKGQLPILNLPTSFERPAIKSYRGDTATVPVNESLMDLVKETSLKHNTGVFTVLLASVSILLHRQANQSRLVIGTPVAGRQHPGLEDQVGLYVNTLSLLFEIGGDESFEDVIQRTREILLEGQHYQSYPIDRLIDALALPKDLSRTPLFDIMVMYEELDDQQENNLVLSGLSSEEVSPDFNVSKFDITFSFIRYRDDLQLKINYNTDIFEKTSIRNLGEEFVRLLDTLTSDPKQVALENALPGETGQQLRDQTVPGQKSRSDKALETSVYKAPESKVEVLLTDFWEEILDRRPIGVNDNFFELGGHSIKATRLIMRVKEKMGWQLKLSDMFEYPTIAKLAAIYQKISKGKHEPIPLAPEQEYYPLSSTQRRLWILSQVDETSAAYQIPVSMMLEGAPLNLSILEQAAQYLLERHESLRTVFVQRDGEAFQRILPTDQLSLQIDHQRVPADNWENEVELRLEKEILKPFDLENGPLWRLLVLEVEHSHKTVLHLNLHHLICDGWSLGILQEELLTSYRIFNKEEEKSLPLPLKLQYKDYANWQVQQRLKEELDKSYWLEKLGGKLPSLELPLDKQRPATQTYNGDHIHRILTTEQSMALHQLSKELGGSLFMVFTTIWKALFHYYSNAEDIILGMPVNGRHHPDLANQVGLFINTLVLRTKFSSSDTFKGLHGKVKQTMLDAQEHDSYPFDQLIEELNVQRVMNRSSLFDVMLDFYTEGQGAELQTISGNKITIIDTAYKISKFDLTFTLAQEQDNLGIYAEYNTDLFYADTVENILTHFINLLSTVSLNPGIKLSQLECLSSGEREEIMTYGKNEVDFEENESILNLFKKTSESAREQIAVMCGDHQISYDELRKQQQIVAELLIGKGIRKGDKVGVLMERSVRLAPGILGIMEAGGVFIPIDINYPKERVKKYLRDVGAKAILRDVEDKEILDLATDYTEVSWSEVLDFEREDQLEISGPEIKASDTAYILFTSGSSGQPKGVIVSHGALLNSAQGWLHSYGLKDFEVRLLSTASVSFDVFCGDLCRSLLSGGTMFMADDSERFDIVALASLFHRHQINIFETTPTLMLSILDQLKKDQIDIRFAKYLIFGADKFLSADYLKVFQAHGDHAAIINSYGMTEAAIDSIFFSSAIDRLPDGAQVPIGRPLPNVGCYVLNEHLKMLPVGAEGELYLGGDGLADGYYGDPVLTSAHFVESPLIPGQKLLRTGDRAKWLEGGLMSFAGRKDTQVKVNGYRISLEEIEAVARGLEGIHGAWAAIQETNNGNKVLVLFYQAMTPIENYVIREYCMQYLPDHMLPSYYVFLTEVKLNENGKLDLNSLPGVIEEDNFKPQLPSNSLEKAIQKIWLELFNEDFIGVNDNFFGIGGNSLKAVQLGFRVADSIKYKLSMKDVFLHPTITEMAEMLSKKEANRYQTIPVADARPYFPLSLAQRKFWVEDKLQERKAAYHIHTVNLLKGELQIAALQQAFIEVVERHEALRTIFSEVDGSPVQIIGGVDAEAIGVNIYDIRGEERKDIMLRDRALKYATDPFDLEEGPLIRSILIRTDDDEYIFAVSMHHIISDEWSMGILINELQTIYNARATGNSHNLETPSVQYKDFAIWQQQLFDRDYLQNAKDYMSGLFSENTDILSLKPDHVVSGTLPQAASSLVSLHLEQTDHIYKFCKQQAITLNNFLFGCYCITLGKATMTDDFILGIISLGRDHFQTAEIIGAFVNTVPVRSQPYADKKVLKFFESIQEDLAHAYEYQNVRRENLTDAGGHNGMFQKEIQLKTIFEMNTMDSSLVLEKVEVHPYDIEIPQPPFFDVSLSCLEDEGTVLCNWTYDKTLFYESTIAQLQSIFTKVIQAILDKTDTTIGEIDLTGHQEKVKQEEAVEVSFDF